MPFPSSLSETLLSVGQAAVEVSCPFEEYREFVSIYRASTNTILAFQSRFPYYSECAFIFRVIRFRVESQRLVEDQDFSQEDLVGLQEIYLPSEEAVEYVLRLWKTPLESLVAPRNTEIPV